MDSLILTFDQKQRDFYKKLLNQENIELNFDISLPEIDEVHTIDLWKILSDMENEAKRILKLNKPISSFATPFTQEEIKALTPVYYDVILQIKRHADIISGESLELSSKLYEIDQALANIYQKYAEFLPYKAALYNKEEYCTEINLIDTRFKEDIQTLDNTKAEILAIFEKSEKITNIVSDFMKKSSKASDEPKFKSFDSRKFFLSVEAFIEQIKNVKYS